MKRLILSATLLILVAGCSSSTAPAASPAAPLPTTMPATQASATLTPINKYCAVDRGNEIDPAVTYLYQGKVIGFCCEDCVPKFKADPEKYMKDLK